jgi:hypothetical protein
MTTTSKTFSTASPIINAVKSFLPIVCGVPESVLSGISDRYVLELTANLGGAILGFGVGKPEFTIHAYLQDKIVLDASSEWSGVIDDIPGAAGLIKTADALMQAATGLTAVTTVSKQRKWTGSSPISMSFKLKFEAINDVYTEVLLPCMGLQSLTLPRGGLANILGLIPPGPSPYTLIQQSKNGGIESRGEQISINIGNFLGFRSVIVKSVKVTYQNRMSKAGPIGAEVDLAIETWRMLTREELESAYKEKMSISQANAIGAV